MTGKTRVSKKTLFLIALIILTFCYWRFLEHPAGSASASDTIDITEAERALIESDNKFGLKLFRQINVTQTDSNVFISPLSISMALSMTLNGADGTTREAMDQTLELTGLTLEEINQSYRHLIDLLTELDPAVQFDIANSIWYEQLDFPEPKDDFLYNCQQFFDALVTGLDFDLPEAASTINAWVDENTNGKIKQIVRAPINPSTVMFLINAIYFKGDWISQFDASLTQDTLFYRPDGTTTTCRMMSQKIPCAFFSNDEFTAVDLPYGDGAYRMTIFVPSPDRDISALVSEFDSQNLNNWLSRFFTALVNVYIPRFTAEYSRKLKDDLTALGMGIAFHPRDADFSNMYESDLNIDVAISEVAHKTFVEVNEEGTEAAAVTSVQIIETTSVQEQKTYLLRADRPFLFMIRENQSGAILFIGKIVDPTAG
jgi:serpin B